MKRKVTTLKNVQNQKWANILIPRKMNSIDIKKNEQYAPFKQNWVFKLQSP